MEGLKCNNQLFLLLLEKLLEKVLCVDDQMFCYVGSNSDDLAKGQEEVQSLKRFCPLHRLALNKFRKIFCFSAFDLNCSLCHVNVLIMSCKCVEFDLGRRS